MKKLPIEAIDACAPRLRAELQEHGIQTAVTMGNSASASLIDRGVTKTGQPKKTWPGITKLRVGPPKRITINGVHDYDDDLEYDINLVATFHPAYCLRSQGKFPLMLSDVAKAVTNDKPMMWYEPNIFAIELEGEALDTIESLLELNRDYGVIVDTESGRDKDTSFGRDDGPYGRILCIGVGGLHQYMEDDVYVFTDEVLAYPSVRDAMRNLLNECGIIAQNGKYDIGVLMNFLDQDDPFPLRFDTMLASYALYEEGGIHSLDYMGQEVLGAPNWKDEVKPYITKDQGYASIPRDILYQYNAFDVHVTRLSYGYFQNLLDEHGVTKINNFLLRASRELTLVERRGMGFDPEVARELIAEYDAMIEEVESQIPFNPRSWQQIQAWLEEHGIHAESTDKDHLQAISESRRTTQEVKDTIDLILEARKYSKAKGTYVTGPLAKLTAAGRVHTSYLLHGTTTGRLSSRGPNLQNIPRKGRTKELYIPHPGNKLIQVDFSQAELRTLTWMAEDEGMRDLFNDPTKDIFVELCREMFPDFDTWDDTRKKETRTLIKTFAYGVAYGRTAEGIASDPDFNMSVQEAQRQMDQFNARIPKIKAFQQDVIKRIHRGEDLVNPFGRHRRFYLITDANRSSVENEAMAFLPQSTASDICLESACRLSHDGVFIVNLVHDAIIVEVSPDEANEVAMHMDKVMCATADEVTGGYVDFATEYKVGDRWSEV